MTKPVISFVRPLTEVPRLLDVVSAGTKPDIDAASGNIIGADGREYVYIPTNDGGYVVVEAIADAAHSYQLRPVQHERARAIFDASIEYWEALKPAPSN